MKQLYVLRHSKAGQTNKKILDDHERTLTQKGIDVCELVGDYFNINNYNPDHIISSTAIRAQETASIVNEALIKNCPIEHSVKLYLAEPDNIFSLISNTADHVERLLVVGHNPGLQQFAMTLAGTGDKKKFREMRSNFPPRALAVYNIDIESWKEIAPQKGELRDFHIARGTKKAAA
jgi:phosphohistidine phosphatase